MVLLNIRWMQNKLATFLIAPPRCLFYIQEHANKDHRAYLRDISLPLSFVNIYDLECFPVTFNSYCRIVFLQEQEAKGTSHSF